MMEAGAMEASRFQILERWGQTYARVALGAAFLSAVAGRFGLWDRKFDLNYFFVDFFKYTGKVNSFLPRAVIPAIAWTATILETSLGIVLIAGLWKRWTFLASAILLAMFGTAMAISFGLKSPLDYSVFSASGAATVLALDAWRQHATTAIAERESDR
jgi:putative oxidoreductase